MNIDLDHADLCGGFSGSQSSTHQAKNFLSASYGKCGSNGADGALEDMDVPIVTLEKASGLMTPETQM